MAQTIERDGKSYVFPDDFTQEQIEQEILNQNVSSKTTEVVEPKQDLPTDDKRGWATDIPLQIVGGARDAAQSTIGLVEDIQEKSTGDDSLMGSAVVFGDNANNGLVGIKTKRQLKEDGLGYAGLGKIGEKDAYDLPEVDDADTKLGAFSRGVSQFMTGWYATKPLSIVKAATTSGKIAGSLAKGAVADVVAFDENTGRFVDMVNTNFPSLQNPLFDYLSSEGKDETWYEARMKNALEGLMIGGLFEGVGRGIQSIDGTALKEQFSKFKTDFVDTAKFMKFNRKTLTGEKIDFAKLKEVENRLLGETTELTPSGKKSSEKLAKKIKDEAGTQKIADTVEVLKEKATADDLNEEIINTFDNFINSARDNVDSGGTKKTIDWRTNLGESLDFKLSPRAYADSNFGTIVLEALQKVVRSERQFDVMGDKIIENQARKHGGDIIQTTKMLGQLGDKLQGGLKFMYASQQIQQNLADALYRQVKDIDGKYTDNDMKLTTALLMRLMRFDEKVTSNLGRGLRLRSVLKDAVTEYDLGSDAILKLVRNMDNWNGNFGDFKKAISMTKDKNAIQRVLGTIFKGKGWNIANELWMSAVLSLPKTQIVNAVSTGVNMYLKPIDLMIGSKLTWGLDPATAKQVKAQYQVGASIMGGYKNYLGDAVTYMKKAFNDEDSILFGGSTKFDTNTKALGNSKYARAARYPLRGLTAGDEFFKQIAYRSYLGQVAIREALEAGASRTKIVGKLPNGKEITEFDQMVANRVRQGFDETGLMGIDKDAARYAQEITFTKDLEGVLGKIQEMTNEAPFLKQILPFVKTPSNLAIQAIERTPLSLLGKETRSNFTGASRNAEKIAATRGRIATGTILLGSIAMYTQSGNITGGFHPDPSIREIQQSQGMIEYAFKIPGTNKWIQYGRLDPIGMLIGFAADVTNIYQDLDEKEKALIENNLLGQIVQQMEGSPEEQLGTIDKVQNFTVASYKSMYKNIASKTYLRALTDFVKSFDGEAVEGQGAWWFNNKAASYFPNILSRVNNDPYMREAQGFFDTIGKKINSRAYPKRYNPLGEAIEYQKNAVFRFINTAINPFTIKEMKKDKLAEAIVEDEIVIPRLDKKQKDVDLTKFIITDKNDPHFGKNAFEVLNEKIAKSGLRKRLEQLIEQEDYKNVPARVAIDENMRNLGGKQNMIYKEVQFYRKLAFDEIQYSDKFKSTINPDISIAQAYIQKDLIKGISGATNQYPQGIDMGVYDFIKQTK